MTLTTMTPSTPVKNPYFNLGLVSPMKIATPPQVVQLEGLSNFHEWIDTLKANLKHHGLSAFIDEDMQLVLPHRARTASLTSNNSYAASSSAAAAAADHPDGTYDNYYNNNNNGVRRLAVADKKRKLVKDIIKVSTSRLSIRLRDEGWNPAKRSPLSHYRAVVRLMAREAEETGLIASLTEQLCRIDRADFLTLAGYQHRLRTLRKQLDDFGLGPGERFILWVGINGLSGAAPRLFHTLVKMSGEEGFGWDAFMEEISRRALKEHAPVAAVFAPSPLASKNGDDY